MELTDNKSTRLVSIIEYVQHTAKMRINPVCNIASHNIFSLNEEDIQGLPGIRINIENNNDQDHVWLSIQRLHETVRPEVRQSLLQPWIEMNQNPFDTPRLKSAVTSDKLPSVYDTDTDIELLSDEIHSSTEILEVQLADYEWQSEVKSLFREYVELEWQPWKDAERLRRKSIKLYTDLFTLRQQLTGSIVDAQIELVMGVGIGNWKKDTFNVSYPLITQVAELVLDPNSGDISVVPRDSDPQMEVDWYSSIGIQGIADLEQNAREFWKQSPSEFSPFVIEPYEQLLRNAVTYLDPNGLYWPDYRTVSDHKIPNHADKLVVTDSWVLFARPRNNNLLIQDLEKFKETIELGDLHQSVASAFVTDPIMASKDIELPNFRGLSTSYGSNGDTTNSVTRDLFFPKPYNDAQVRIIQLLEVHDGVVVQGPPGTGKTHTIANVICHYLAHGRRVLVTSMKDPALGVLRSQLPPEIRSLVISLLTTEQDGMKQFEYAINKIASEITGFDKALANRKIETLNKDIDSCHINLSLLDRQISDWAKSHFAPIDLDEEKIEPQVAAKEIVDNIGQFEFITDNIGPGKVNTPLFNDQDVIELREARRILQQDILELDSKLPNVRDLPDSNIVTKVHQDTLQYNRLNKANSTGEIPALRDSSDDTISKTRALAEYIHNLKVLNGEIEVEKCEWSNKVRQSLRTSSNRDVFVLLESLGSELDQASNRRRAYLQRPVTTPADMEIDPQYITAINNLSEGRLAFGVVGMFGKSLQQSQLKTVRVTTASPESPSDWKYVLDYLTLLKHLRELACRWNALATELSMVTVSDNNPNGGIEAYTQYCIYAKVKSAVGIETKISRLAMELFPEWGNISRIFIEPATLLQLEDTVHHHLTKHRLSDVFVQRERINKAVEGTSGRISNEIRSFIAQSLGNGELEEKDIQLLWSQITGELSRLHQLWSHFDKVHEVCNKIEASGAPKYAESLKKPVSGIADDLLPDNWRNAWRWRRIYTHFNRSDAHSAIHSLSSTRLSIEKNLSRAYQDIVEKRTWLTLTEQASPGIRSALQAYLNEIKKIGMGTGKRAVRHRQGAREAALQATPAIPCWIMPHYRVSESLPSELGCFDLVIIDEASQSDLSALPAILRAKKILVVGDDKQVSPEGVGLDESKIQDLMDRYLRDQVLLYRPQMTPERSIYDLCKVVFANAGVMLKEHFRCVAPIIEYSKREFYDHELHPLRTPVASQRLDPPLIDILVMDGYRNGYINDPEVTFIISEIKRIVSDPKMEMRSIGVVSLLGDKQARRIWDRLADELGTEILEKFQVACGDSKAFQGKERDIMFLSMVIAPNDMGVAANRETFQQRYNVAASRAKDRMYLVRSVRSDQLSPNDQLRRRLIGHFSAPFAQDELRVSDLRELCESDFEKELYDELSARGYRVIPQMKVGRFRIDLVIEGLNDARLAVECDGDRYHGPDRWADDWKRQAILERAGWIFWRCLASDFIRRRTEMVDDLLAKLEILGIDPIGQNGAHQSVHTEYREVISTTEQAMTASLIFPANSRLDPNVVYKFDNGSSSNLLSNFNDMHDPGAYLEVESNGPSYGPRQSYVSTIPDLPKQQLSEYIEYNGVKCLDPRKCDRVEMINGLVRVVSTEGPIVVRRAFEVYLNSCGIKKLGKVLNNILSQSLQVAIREGLLLQTNDDGTGEFLASVIRVPGMDTVKLRKRGPRAFEDIPLSEIQLLGRAISKTQYLEYGSQEHMRAILSILELKRLTVGVEEHLQNALTMNVPLDG